MPRCVKKQHPPPKVGGNSWQIGWQLSDRKLACHPILQNAGECISGHLERLLGPS